MALPHYLWPDRAAMTTMMEFKNTGIGQTVIDDLRSRAWRYGIRRLVLFGLRVCGDYRPKSDIDLAVLGGDIVRFALGVDEETPTLLLFDVVDLESAASTELWAEVERDGSVFYGHEKI